MIKVYLNNDIMNYVPGSNYIPGRDQLFLVADILVNDLHEAFHVGQNPPNGSWLDKTNVGKRANYDKSRSISSGDVLEKDGHFYLIESDVFKEIFNN